MLEARVVQFLMDLRDPERFGHAVSDEVRRAARELSRDILMETTHPQAAIPPSR